MLGYEIVALDKQGENHQRELLDLHALTAQWSFLAVAFTVQIFLGGTWAFNQIAAGNSNRELNVSSFRRLHCWLGQKASNRALSKGEKALVALWTIWLLFLYLLHLTRRFGAIGMSQLPLHYALGRRSMNAGLQLLTRLPHDSMLSLHQLLGRIVFALFSLHAACYTYFFVKSGLLSTRIRDWDVVAGMGSYFCLVVLVLGSLGRVRTGNYRVFYTTHAVTSSLGIGLFFLHTPHARIMTAEMLAVRLADELARRAGTRTLCGTVVTLLGTNLVRVTMDTPFPGEATIRPGQHLLLGRPPLGRSAATRAVMARLFANPFTVASVPEVDGQLVLVCRTCGSGSGGTARLSAVARSLVMAEGISHIPLTIEGPYGAAGRPAAELVGNFERVLVIAGGVGATFGIPVYRNLRVASMSSGGGGSHVRFMWVVRSLADATWAFSGERTAAELHGSELYVTHQAQGRVEETRADAGLLGGDVELTELSSSLDEQQHKCTEAAMVTFGRPHLSAMIDEACAETTGGVAVLVCGPQRMVSELWACVRRLKKKGKQIYWHAEQFGT
ncbi:ferric reductase transmembrane component [Pyrenophora tritici-repentis]|nr:ferric reductase transmembrane component [Pyrenophora tritici-repentis]KAI2483720.1 ferric reductase transmembrane component [Pyrenophora tritici-repentis]